MNDGGAIHLNPEKNTSLLCISSCFLGFYPLKHKKQDLECSPPPPPPNYGPLFTGIITVNI